MKVLAVVEIDFAGEEEGTPEVEDVQEAAQKIQDIFEAQAEAEDVSFVVSHIVPLPDTYELGGVQQSDPSPDSPE